MQKQITVSNMQRNKFMDRSEVARANQNASAMGSQKMSTSHVPQNINLSLPKKDLVPEKLKIKDTNKSIAPSSTPIQSGTSRKAKVPDTSLTDNRMGLQSYAAAIQRDKLTMQNFLEENFKGITFRQEHSIGSKETSIIRMEDRS